MEDRMLKVLCIHHNDSDGRLSGAIIKYKYPNAKLIEVGYNDYKDKLKFILNEEAIPNYDKVFMLDFSMEKEEMEMLIKEYDVIWCDHHKSAMEKLQHIWDNKEICGLRSLDKCGAMLTWNYFGNEAFEELKLVDDYDRWQHKLGMNTHWFAELNKDWDINQWIDVIKNTGTGVITNYLLEGEKLFILKIDRVKKAIEKGIPVIFKNKKTLLVNNTNTMDGALLGNMICEKGFDIAIKFEFNKNKIIFGLNSIGDLDVSIIAKEFGGGGHKNASGFILDINEFKCFLDDEIIIEG